MTGKNIALIIGAIVGALVVCLGGFFVVSVLGCMGIFASTEPAAKAADRLLTLVGEGKIAEAYKSTARDFQTQETLDSFTATMKQMRLTEHASANWNTGRGIHIKNEVTWAELQGTFTTKGGESYPLKVKVLREGEDWRVLTLTMDTLPPPSPQQSPPQPVVDAGKNALPPQAELERLVASTLLELNKAIQTKDYKSFHASTSAPFQQQRTPADLQKAFQAFSDQKIDLKGIKELIPLFDPLPSLDQNQWLHLSGSYATQPSRVMFQLKYIQEPPGWKLIGIDVKVGP